ncbi:hypothetical protein [Bradyrhizobium guangzhouense]|uniref:Uncharacterized protein n=1 Tax=Bradyrhizobium guangzhouense TaxID=1325095 RepID=A0AAE5X2C8_9BRAD|nr:hypothetical protein [Bradyrhizobium guangzhouense]QAU47460.1 hypothetical protein XH91_20320 [Bradyrhizobium guangzhouense]RXH06797.1 hypothetical protein EAS56_33625 [Bradyrhizobium guangzhouense]
MGNRTAKFLSALAGSIIAGAPLAAVSQNAPSAPAAASAASAASDCLASPKGTAPQGQHWHYHVERGTKRQCWYLRAEGAKATTTAQTANDSPQPDSSPPQSVQNARAEYIAPQSTAAQAAPAAATPQPAQPASATSGEPQQPAVAARWPDTTTAAAAPMPQPAAAADQASAQPSESPAPVALAAADSADKPTGSLQTLLLVIVAALALAGLIASVIYRFAGGRARVQTADRRVSWNRQDDDNSRAPWHTAPRAERPLPVDFDAVRPQAPQIAAFSDAIGRIASQGRSTEVAVEEPDETGIDHYDDEFEIEASASPLAADRIHEEEPVPHAAGAHEDHPREDNAVDIDIITAMLERMASEGPRLTQPSLDPSLEADLAALARSSRARSAARA